MVILRGLELLQASPNPQGFHGLSGSDPSRCLGAGCRLMELLPSNGTAVNGSAGRQTGGWGVVGREEELNFPCFLLRVKVVNERELLFCWGLQRMNECLIFWSPAFLDKLNVKQWLCSHDVLFLAAIVQVLKRAQLKGSETHTSICHHDMPWPSGSVRGSSWRIVITWSAQMRCWAFWKIPRGAKTTVWRRGWFFSTE